MTYLGAEVENLCTRRSSSLVEGCGLKPAKPAKEEPALNSDDQG